MPFAATWMNPETDILSETRQTENSNISEDIPYMWHPKRNRTNEHIYKAETDSQTSYFPNPQLMFYSSREAESI